MVQVKTFYAYNDLRNYSYLIYDDETGSSWVIDPFDAVPIIEYIKKQGLVLKGILNTHQHFDHIKGNVPLMDAFQAPVKKLESSEEVNLSSIYTLETLDSPGHTMDHQVFVWKELDKPLALFSGDTLFNSGVGNCKNGGDVNLLFDTTQKLMTLPKSVILYPGHDYRKRNLEFALNLEPDNKKVQESLRALKDQVTELMAPNRLEDEILVNPFFRLQSEQIKETTKVASNSDRELFKQLRSLRDQW